MCDWIGVVDDFYILKPLQINANFTCFQHGPCGDVLNDSDDENSFEKSPDGMMSGPLCFMTDQDEVHLKSESFDVM